MEKFRGDFNELETHVSALGYVGEWSQENGKSVFRSEDGAILNWWSSTGTLNVQGPKPARTKLEEALSGSLTGSRPADGDSDSNAAVGPSAGQFPSAEPTLSSSSEESKGVFVVYGHDDVACEQLELVLHRLDLDPFVLGNTSGGGLTIIEALEREIVSPSKPESTDGRREGWANWDEGAYKGESLGSIGTDVTRQRVFSSRTGPRERSMEAGNRVIVRSDASLEALGRLRIAPSGWEWDGSQPGQGESGLLSPGPAPGKMQSESARRAGEPSGHREEASSEGLGGHQLLAQTDARCPTGQIMRQHL